MSIHASHTLAAIATTILDENSSAQQLQQALEAFSRLCSEISGIEPDPSYDGWRDDIFLDHGVAINPQAAAFCIRDYRRTVVYMRALNAAIKIAQQRFAPKPTKLLYAGCGPFATLLLPLLTRYQPGSLEITLLDIHASALDSVNLLLHHFHLDAHTITLLNADACHYQHADSLHLIIAETMQKALEQEPQFAVTANLAPQLCAQGIFIPRQITVQLFLANLQNEEAIFQRDNSLDYATLSASNQRYTLATVLTLIPEQAAALLRAAQLNQRSATLELATTQIHIPALENLDKLEAALFTHITVFEQYHLHDYEAQITLPSPCHELSPLTAGAEFAVCYQLGKYPKFNFTSIP